MKRMSADVPPSVMDLLKIFLAASTRGEQAVLILESRKGTLSTKLRSLEEIVAGAPAPTAKPSVKRRKNPARARRSQLRLKEFTRKSWRKRRKLLLSLKMRRILTDKQFEIPAASPTSWSWSCPV